MRGATAPAPVPAIETPISIHAPRAGCDRYDGRCDGQLQHFNPRTPCGVRPVVQVYVKVHILISIHAPRAGCDYGNIDSGGDVIISIHAPRAGCDAGGDRRVQPAERFQSTHPVRGATRVGQAVAYIADISIHAPRAGCDYVR